MAGEGGLECRYVEVGACKATGHLFGLSSMEVGRARAGGGNDDDSEVI